MVHCAAGSVKVGEAQGGWLADDDWWRFFIYHRVLRVISSISRRRCGLQKKNGTTGLAYDLTFSPYSPQAILQYVFLSKVLYLGDLISRLLVWMCSA